MNEPVESEKLILTKQQKLLRALSMFVLGAVLGFLAKYTDSISIIGDIGTYLGIWILVATILAAWSRSPKAAALHIFCFFIGILSVYYVYSTVLFGFFPKSYFLAWGIFALLSPIGAYIVWYGRGNGWIAALCAALPIVLLLAEGYSFYYTLSVLQGFDLVSAILLFAILPTQKLQRLRVLPFVIIIFFIIWRGNLISVLFGGL